MPSHPPENTSVNILVPDDALRSAIREHIRDLQADSCSDVTITPILLRALGHAIHKTFNARYLNNDLLNARRGTRATHAIKEDGMLYEGVIAMHVRDGIVVTDPLQAETMWLIDDLLTRLGELRDAHIRDDLSDAERERDIALLWRLTHILEGRAIIDDDSITRLQRHFVLSCAGFIGELRLTHVLRRLLDSNKLDRELAQRCLAPMFGDETRCLVALVTSRYPDVGSRLSNVEDCTKEYLARLMHGKSSKWAAALELMQEIGLWSMPGENKQGRRTPNDPANTLRADFQKNKDVYAGDLSRPEIRASIWSRVSAFLELVGFGEIPQLELIATHAIVAAQPAP